MAICSGYNSPDYRLFGCQFLVEIFRNFLHKSLKLSGLFLFCTYCLLLLFRLSKTKAVPLHFKQRITFPRDALTNKQL